jgi:nucleoside-diphosphate-sugar epimerase
MNTVLVTGGAGSMGRQVALQLAASGHRVRILDLPMCDFSAFDGKPGLEIVKGSIEDEALLARAVAGVDTVIHLAALLPPGSERDRQRTMSINLVGTERLLEALERSSPEAHLVFSSSVCVYGDTSPREPPVAVTAQPRPVDLYGESKARAEEAIRKRGVQHTILRIAGVSVPEFLEPPAVWPFAAQQRIEFVCREDVVTALIACVGSQQVWNKTLNIAGGPTWRMLGHSYVGQFNAVMGLDPDDGRYLDRPGTFDWYDTAESQALLSYQQTSFGRFLELLGEAIEQALADWS